MNNAVTKPARQKWQAKLPLSVGFVALITLLVGFGGWSVFTIISGAIVAPGRIEVENNRQVVQHPTGGVVGEINVQEGASVEAGQVLLRLDDTTVKSELAVVEGQYFELIARRGGLEAERDGRDTIQFDPKILQAAADNPEIQNLLEGQQRLFEARRTSLQSELNQMHERKVQISAQIDGLEAQLGALEKQLVLTVKELADQQNLLDKGLAQASRVSQLQREVARIEGLKGEIAASKAEAGGRMVENDIGILRVSSARREDAITKLRDMQYREFELAERRIVAKDSLEKLAIRAPMSGSVYGLEVHAVRSVIQPAQPLMYIVPKDRRLVISSRVDPIHVDQVYVGQKVILHFSAFNSRTTPELNGTIVKLSADAFTDQATRVSYYQVEIAPLPGEYAKLEGLVLLPGMPVEAFIKTADRSPLSYLIKPMAEYFNKAFREE